MFVAYSTVILVAQLRPFVPFSRDNRVRICCSYKCIIHVYLVPRYEARVYALTDDSHKDFFKCVFLPFLIRLTHHAMVRYGILEIAITTPHIIETLINNIYKFAFTCNIIKEQQKNHFKNDDRIN